MVQGVGRPATTVQLCSELHTWLIGQGIPPDYKIPRPDWDQIVARGCGVADAQVRNITRTGEQHGYWRRTPNQGSINGSVALLHRALDVGHDLVQEDLVDGQVADALLDSVDDGQGGVRVE